MALISLRKGALSVPRSHRESRWILAILGAACLNCAVSGGGARAQSTPTFFFEKPGQTPASASQGLTTLTTSSAGNFTLSVWYTFQPVASETYYGIDLFIGYDQASQSGTGATPQNNTVVLGSGLNAQTAVTNVNSSFTDISNAVGGGADPSSSATPSSAIRPYGLDINLASVAGFAAPGSTPVHLADITLNDADLAAGLNQSIVIYSNDPAGDDSSFTSYVDDGSGNPSAFARPAQSYLLSLIQGANGSATPEPSSLPLASGVLAVGLISPRTRRRATGLFRRAD